MSDCSTMSDGQQQRKRPNAEASMVEQPAKIPRGMVQQPEGRELIMEADVAEKQRTSSVGGQSNSTKKAQLSPNRPSRSAGQVIEFGSFAGMAAANDSTSPNPVSQGCQSDLLHGVMSPEEVSLIHRLKPKWRLFMNFASSMGYSVVAKKQLILLEDVEKIYVPKKPIWEVVADHDAKYRAIRPEYVPPTVLPFGLSDETREMIAKLYPDFCGFCFLADYLGYNVIEKRRHILLEDIYLAYTNSLPDKVMRCASEVDNIKKRKDKESNDDEKGGLSDCAVHGRETKIVRRSLLQGEAKIAIEKEWFRTIRAKNLNLKAIEDLILNGADVNAKDTVGLTALHLSCCHKNENVIDVMRLLIENGADTKTKSNSGRTALNFLCKKYKNENLIDIVRLLIQNGADINAKDSDGCAVLHIFCGNYKNENLIDIARLLIKNGADTRVKDSDGWTVLHLLCENYNNENLIDIARLLIQNGAEINAKDKDGWTALHWLCQNYQNENLIHVVRLLIQNGADINAKDSDGWTALHLLCQYYNNENLIDIVQLLITNGVNVNAKDNVGQTPRDLIRAYYNKKNVEEILKLLGE